MPHTVMAHYQCVSALLLLHARCNEACRSVRNVRNCAAEAPCMQLVASSLRRLAGVEEYPPSEVTKQQPWIELPVTQLQEALEKLQA